MMLAAPKKFIDNIFFQTTYIPEVGSLVGIYMDRDCTNAKNPC